MGLKGEGNMASKGAMYGFLNRSFRHMLSTQRKVCFSKLCKQRRFKEIDEILRDTSVEGGASCMNSVPSSARYVSLLEPVEYPLHLLLMHQPPVSSVQLLLKRMMEINPYIVPGEIRDTNGQTPLHVAAKHNADRAVIECLLNGETLVMPAVSRDCNDWFPLHCACSTSFPRGSSSNNNNNNNNNRVAGNSSLLHRMGRRENHRGGGDPRGGNSHTKKNNVAVVKALLRAYPQAANMRDKFGQTPVDMARENHLLDESILRILEAESSKTAATNPTTTEPTTTGREGDDDSESEECVYLFVDPENQEEISMVTPMEEYDSIRSVLKLAQNRRLYYI